jgi:hypothetical protein
VFITIPAQSSVTWPGNTEIMFEQGGTGQINLQGAVGVTLNTSETLKSSGQYAVIAAKRVAE